MKGSLFDLEERINVLYEEYQDFLMSTSGEELRGPQSRKRRTLADMCRELARLHEDIADEFRRRADNLERWNS